MAGNFNFLSDGWLALHEGVGVDFGTATGPDAAEHHVVDAGVSVQEISRLDQVHRQDRDARNRLHNLHG